MGQQSEIKLSVNSWHAKLIKWVFGFDPEDFNNLCPYFWLLIASILFVIPVTPFRLISRVLSLLGKKIRISKKKNIEKSFEKFIKNLSKGEIFYIMCGSDESLYKLRTQSKYWAYSPIINHQLEAKLLIAAGGDRVKRIELWYEMIKIITEKYVKDESWKSWVKEFDEEARQLKKIRDELELAKKEKKKRKSRAINDIIAVTKFIVRTLTTLLLVPIGYIFTTTLTNIFVWLFTRGSDFYMDLLWVLIAIVILVLLQIYAGWSWKSIREWKTYGTKKLTIEWIILMPALPIALLLWVLKLVAEFIWDYVIIGVSEGIHAGIKEYGGIFSEYLNASYSDYCPGINWKKEDDK